MTGARSGGADEALYGALEYAQAGYLVGPVTVRVGPDGAKTPEFHTRWEHPREGEVSVSSDPDQLMAWARQYPGTGWHAPCGPNGFVLVDGDRGKGKPDRDGVVPLKDGVAAWTRAGGPTSPMTVSTRSGGRHWYFAAPGEDSAPIHNSASVVAPGVDVRGEGGTVFIGGTTAWGPRGEAVGSYVAERVLPVSELPELPGTWEETLRAASRGGLGGAGAGETRASGVAGLHSVADVHDIDWVRAQYGSAVREAEGLRAYRDFRQGLFRVAVTLFKCADRGLLTRSEANDILRSAVWREWHAEPDARDRQWVAEARERARVQPWVAPATEPRPVGQDDPGTAPDPVTTGPDPSPSGGDLAGPDSGEGSPAPFGGEVVPFGGEVVPFGDEDSDADDEVARRLEHARRLPEEIERLRLRREAEAALAAESAPELVWLDADGFLDGPEPEPLVPGMLYKDSLARIYGKAGCGKSFVALDIAYSLATGSVWGGIEPPDEGESADGAVVGVALERTRVAYVMAEGQRVNTRRAKAWLDRHRVDRSELAGWFFAVPHKVALVEAGVADLAARVREWGIGLVILDTKNAMMVGDENSATDINTMRMAMDAIREASGACVVLIDHTGLTDDSRARGSSAGEGAVETEVRVSNDGGHPAKVTATITRDKDGESGREWEWMLRMHPIDDGKTPAVLVPLGDTDLPSRRSPEEVEFAWRESDRVLPEEVSGYTGWGEAAVPDLARFMSHDAGRADLDGIGVTQAQAKAALAIRKLGKAGHSGQTVHRAWSALRNMGWIVPADGKDGSDGKAENTTGKHVWSGS